VDIPPFSPPAQICSQSLDGSGSDSLSAPSSS
jgi:hypothetical protein